MSQSTRQPGSRRSLHCVGFTLIEVLVVVAIIALLISILLPSLQEARYQAKNTACLSNLHQIGVASSAYAAQSKRNVFPDWWTVGGASYRVIPGMALAPSPFKEKYGLPAVYSTNRIIPEDVKVWVCPLNEFDAKHGQTYWWSNGDSITQDPNSYNSTARAGTNDKTRPLWVLDNHNGKPYTSGIPRPPDREKKLQNGEVAFDRTLDTATGRYQGNNAPFFLPPDQVHYYHKGLSSRWRTDRDDPNKSIKTFGRGVNGIHFDLSAGFMAIGG